MLLSSFDPFLSFENPLGTNTLQDTLWHLHTARDLFDMGYPHGFMDFAEDSDVIQTMQVASRPEEATQMSWTSE